MSRKPKKGYFVRGVFVAEGSELDLAYKRELKGTDTASKTDLKRESDERQQLGEDLLTLRGDLCQRLLDQGHLDEKLLDAVAEAKRITNFEGRRRQMQFIGKLMRKLEDEAVQALREALQAQHSGSAKETLALHQAEHWRERLLQSDAAVAEWISTFPETDSQQLRALVRQARKDNTADKTTESQGLAPRQGRSYREIFQLVKLTLQNAENAHE